MSSKTSYVVNADHKITTRDRILPKHKYTRLVGLGGPNLRPYLARMWDAGFRDFHIYEMDMGTVAIQILQIPGTGVTLYAKTDIYDAEYRADTFYDLDFCCTIVKIGAHIRKFCFGDNWAITVCLRPIGLSRTIRLFAEAKGETLISDYYHAHKQVLLTTNKGKYLFTKYHDTSAMVMITPYNES